VGINSHGTLFKVELFKHPKPKFLERSILPLSNGPPFQPVSTSQTFLITGAIGQQGGHAARLRGAAGHEVHALVRNPSSEAVTELESLGASIFPGDFSDSEAIFTATQGCGVFINVSPVFSDPEG
jgi:NmrA-like family